MAEGVTKHESGWDYSTSGLFRSVVTRDEVHPTDQLYYLIWLEIYEQIKQSNCTFGNLFGSAIDAPLLTLLTENPVMQTGQSM